MSTRWLKPHFTLLVAVLFGATTAVSADQAELGTTLTPFGAERAGSKDGLIPAWDGGYTAATPGYAGADPRQDPFASERPLFSISAKNMDQHTARLTDGTQAMLKKYPDTYRLDVYPSHRTAAAPQRIYDATRRNAISARTASSAAGPVPEGAYGGIPFPLPKSGAEAIWNHLLRWRGGSYQARTGNYLTTADGAHVLVDGGTFETQQPYYALDGSVEKFSGDYVLVRITSEAPVQRKGATFVGRDNLNPDKSDSWAYFPGQRRVRKLPNACCDMPLPSAAGVIAFDEPDVWNGRIDRYDWTIVGKAEMYIPYNSNRSIRPPVGELLGAHHLNPDHVRWELHRVWVVEAKLAPGQRNPMSRGRYYLEEDTWIAVLGDRWNAAGTLARTLWALPLVLPDVPAVAAATSGGHDLLSGVWIAMGVLNERPEPYKIVPYLPDTHFTPDALAGESVR